MKIKHLFIATAAFALGLAGCSKSDDGAKSGSNFDMFMQMDMEAVTRAAVDFEVNTSDLTVFGDGAIFFTRNDADETIVRMVKVSSTGQAGSVSASQLANGYLFKDVQASAVKVYIVGNYDFGSRTFADMNEVRALTVNVTNQKDDYFGIGKVTLYGFADIQPVGSSTYDSADIAAAIAAQADRLAVTTISPIMARFEIDKISGDAPHADNSPSDIDEFTIAGIYINNYYYRVSLTDEPTATDDPVHNSNRTPAWPNKYEQYARTTATPPGQYDPAWEGLLFDDSVFGTTEALSHEPADFDADMVMWAYNVFADGSAVPHIVLHLENAKVNGNLRPNEVLDGPGASSSDPNAGTAYITVTGYYTRNTTADEPILGGNVYKMADLAFSDDNLTDEPYEENEDRDKVWVKVTVKPWEVKQIDPNYG